MEESRLRRLLNASERNEDSVAAITDYFAAHELHYGHGTDNAADEAYWLWRHLQDWGQEAWDGPPDHELDAAAARIAARRAAERVPLAYLINEAWFAGLKFYVDENVLVPRSPLAELVERCFEPWCKLRSGERVLDIGTGSGCIAIAAARYCPDVCVDATDVSARALRIARRNASEHGVEDRVEFFEADFFPRGRGPYRVIISNPPYVSEAEFATLPAEYLHEPREGLVGGQTGLEPALGLLASAPRHLTADGVLIVEVGNGADALAEAVPGLAVTWVDFERGGEGVFVVSAAEIVEFTRHGGLPAAPR